MFFVGATGQLLTLILTVCLPLILFVSGHQNIEIQNSTSQFEINRQHISYTISSNDDVSILNADFCDGLQNSQIDFVNTEKLILPFEKPLVKWKTFCLNKSGNKAPPASVCFSC